MQGSSFTSPISAVDQSIHSPQATHSSPHIRLSQENWKEMKPISFGVEIVEAVKPRGGRDDPKERMAFSRSHRAPPLPPGEKSWNTLF